jgi:hypothetical protein
MKLQHFLVGLLIASAFIAGTTSFIGSLSVHTGITVDQSYDGTYDKIDDSLLVAKEADEQLQDSQISGQTPFDPLQLATFPILGIVHDSYEIVVAVIHDVSTDLNLDAWIAPVLLGIVIFLLLFAILNAVFGRSL